MDGSKRRERWGWKREHNEDYDDDDIYFVVGVVITFLGLVCSILLYSK